MYTHTISLLEVHLFPHLVVYILNSPVHSRGFLFPCPRLTPRGLHSGLGLQLKRGQLLMLVDLGELWIRESLVHQIKN